MSNHFRTANETDVFCEDAGDWGIVASPGGHHTDITCCSECQMPDPVITTISDAEADKL